MRIGLVHFVTAVRRYSLEVLSAVAITYLRYGAGFLEPVTVDSSRFFREKSPIRGCPDADNKACLALR